MADGATVVVGSEHALRQVVAKQFLSRMEQALARAGRFVAALPGGSVANAFLPVLAALTIDWSRVDLFWIDERAVPPDHSDSNYGLAWRLLLEPARVPAERVHRMCGELADLDEAARVAADELTRAAGDPPQIDFALVGFGDDGHIASIFPGRAEAADRAVMAVYDAPKPPPRRLTMTLPTIARARSVVVAGFGATKSRVAHDAMHAGAGVTPIGELLRRAPAAVVLLDSPFSH
jgi:6-phosphogluconolactonase